MDYKIFIKQITLKVKIKFKKKYDQMMMTHELRSISSSRGEDTPKDPANQLKFSA